MSVEGTIAGPLVAVLRAEEEIYLELRELLREEQECMVELDAAGLERIVRRKERISQEGALLEESRRHLATELATKIGCSGEPVSLGELRERLGDRGVELADIHGRLRSLVASVRELSDVNGQFAGHSLARVQSTLRLLGRFAPERATYGPSATVDQPARAGRLLRQAI